MTVNGTLVEDKMRGFKGKCAHFSFSKFPIYTHDSASAKFSTNSQETDNSVCNICMQHVKRSKQKTYLEKTVVFDKTLLTLEKFHLENDKQRAEF